MKKASALMMVYLLCFLMFPVFTKLAKADYSPFQILWRAPIRDVYWENNNGPWGVYPGDLGVDCGDVDGDGIDDIATIPNDWNYGGEGDINTLQVFKSDGSELWSTSVLIQGGRVAIADVDLDGKGEVFVFGTSTNIDLGWGPPKTTIYAFDHDGTKMWEYIDYEDTGGRLARWITFTNIDADPELEVIAANGCWLDTFTYALDTDGSLKWRFTGNENNHMLFGDVTGDGVEEVITLSNVAHMVYVIDKLTGNLLWSYSTINYNLGVLGDITGDGINDIIVSSGGEELYYGNKLYAFRNDGTLLWSKDYAGGGSNAPTIPVVQDIDGDSVKDVIVGAEQKIIAYKSDGTPLWTYGDPAFFNYQTPWLYRFDVDRDGQDEIIFLKGKDVYQITKYGDVSLVGTLPVADAWSIEAFGSMGKVTEKASTETAWLVSGDINNDGFDELFLHEIIDGQFYITVITIEYPGEEAVIFFDDFESYAVGTFPSAGGWILVYDGMGDQYQKVVDITSVSGTKSLQLWGKYMWSAGAYKAFVYSSKIIGYELYVKVDEYGAYWRNAEFGFRSSKTGTCYARIGFTSDGRIYVDSYWLLEGGAQIYDLNTTYNVGVWYKIRVVVDTEHDLFNVWIDDSLKGENLPTSGSSDIDTFVLGSSHAGVKVFYDDVKVFVPQVELRDFRISVSPGLQAINPGETAMYIISVTPVGQESSEVYLRSEWIGTPPSGAGGYINPTRLIPPSTATLTVTTSSTTNLGQFTIKIIARSGSIQHSINVTLQVGFAVEIEITKFHVKKDFDPVAQGWADVYFYFDINGELYRAPREGCEPNVGDEYYVGPVYVPKTLLTLPFTFKVKAMDSDAVGDHDELGTFDFIVNSLPWQEGASNANIYILISVRELSKKTIYMEDRTNDPYNFEQWYWFEVSANKVWREYKSEDFEEVVVAVIDTGVDYTHPDLQNVIWINNGEIGTDSLGRDKRYNHLDDDGNGYVDDWIGYDFLTNDPDPMPTNYEGAYGRDTHGTLVAGIIAAKANNGIGIAGVAPNVKIMPLRVMGTEYILGQPVFCGASILELAKAIRYAVDNGAKVISLSLGGYWEIFGLSLADWTPVKLEIDYAYKNGVVVIAAAGNDRSSKPAYPASFENVISVSGLSRYHVKGGVFEIYEEFIQKYSDKFNATYLALWGERGENFGSNYGPDLSNPKKSIEVSAPGCLIISTSIDHEKCPALDGTSLATPIASAVTSMIIGYAQHKYPNRPLNPNEIRYILAVSCIDLGPNGWDPYYGYGVVNAYRSLQKVDELLSSGGWQIRLDPPADIDLHVYDSCGRHVGLNYETGDLEVDIPGAVHTGDETGGFETIFLPLDIINYKVKIVNREAEDAHFSLNISTYDSSGGLILQEILQGVVRANSEITFNTEGTEEGEFQIKPFTLNIITTVGGTTQPTPGTYTYSPCSTVQITAIPNFGYTFDHWELNGADAGSVNPYALYIDKNYTLKAFFVLSPPPLTVSITPTYASIIVGQSVTLISTVSGGYPPYNYQWYLNGAPVLGATSASWTFTPTTSGIYYTQLKVTDSKGNIAQSDAARIAVASVPVGGYSIPINVKTNTGPAIPYTMIIAVLTIGFTIIKRKTTRNKE